MNAWRSRKIQKWAATIAFVAGFLFDTMRLGRIDSRFTLVQHACYLALSLALLASLIRSPGEGEGSRRYREPAFHFLVGSLLNAYTIFYFKSASLFSSFAFLALLCVLLFANQFRKRFPSPWLKVALLSLCLSSYFVVIVPIAYGSIGSFPFLLAMLASVAAGTVFWLTSGRNTRQVLVPFVSIVAAFSLLYFARVLPPVPLSISHMGIYHRLKKKDGAYVLSTTRQRDGIAQRYPVFKAREGDVLHFFVRVFSPTSFRDEIRIRWLYREAGGHASEWKSMDTIPIEIVGGREEGYRGYSTKSHYKEGLWSVQVETADRRELGRLYFKVESDPSSGKRSFIREKH